MTRFLILAAVLILCDAEASDCSRKSTERRVYNEKPSFDYLLFVQSWVPGFCAMDPCHPPPCQVPDGKPRWTMHGLWPTSDDHEGPFCCFPYKFDINKIKSLVGALNSSWPNSCVNRPYDWLWKHEYEKHGTCASVLPQFRNESDFFANTLRIRDRMDFYSALSNSGIVPDKEKTYKGIDIKEAFRKAFNATPYLECTAGSRAIFQASFCLNKDTLSVFECEDYVYKRATCWDTDDVTYYPFS